MVAVPSIGRASLLEQGAAAPEATATHDLYQRHGERIHGYCLRQLGSREEAEDAVQTTFMNAFGALRKGVVPESEAAWLFKIAENVCLSRRRSSWRRGRIESPADFAVIEEVVAGPDSRRDDLIGIEDALAAMPTQQRRAILLREWQGLSYREIAAELDLTQAAVETLIFRARRSLARGLEEPEAVNASGGRRGLRKARRLGDLASVFMGVKALIGGTAAAHAAIAAVTVTAVAGVTARPASELVPDSVTAKSAPVANVVPASPAPAVPPSKRASDVAAAQAPRRAAAVVQQGVPVERRPRPARAAASVVPAGKAPAGAGAGADTSPPGRDVAATRPGETGKPDATPGKPPPASDSRESGRTEKQAKPETPARPEKTPRAAPPETRSKPEKAEPSATAKRDKPSTKLPATVRPPIETPTRTVTPGAPGDGELPEQARELPAEAAPLPEHAAEPPTGPPPVSRRS